MSFDVCFSDWVQAITRFLKDQLQKVIEHYQSPQMSFLTAGQTNSIDIDTAIKNWHYCTDLARHLYEEGLLDRQELLTWLVELLEKLKINDYNVLKLILWQILKVRLLLSRIQLGLMMYK